MIDGGESSTRFTSREAFLNPVDTVKRSDRCPRSKRWPLVGPLVWANYGAGNGNHSVPILCALRLLSRTKVNPTAKANRNPMTAEDKPMSKPVTTARDRSLLILIAIPIGAFVVLMLAAGAKWQTETAKIRPLLLKNLPSEIVDAPSPIFASDQATANSDQTTEYRQLGFAISRLNEKYGLLFEIFKDENAILAEVDPDREAGKITDEYLAEAAPLIRRLTQLNVETDQIWLPNEYSNPVHSVDDSYGFRTIPRMVKTEFRRAVELRDSQRALKALELYDRLGGISSSDIQMVSSVVQSIATGIWSEVDLQRVGEIASSRANYQQEYNQMMRSSLIHQIPWLLKGYDLSERRGEPFLLVSAPSYRTQWLGDFKRIGEIRSFGNPASTGKFQQLQTETSRSRRERLDASIQFPVYGNLHRGVFTNNYLVRSFIRRTNERRFVLTAIALVQYQSQFGTFPESLPELTEVGLPDSEMIDPSDRYFSYQRTDGGCRLSNASEWFSDQSGWAAWKSGTQARLLAGSIDPYAPVAFNESDFEQ